MKLTLLPLLPLVLQVSAMTLPRDAASERGELDTRNAVGLTWIGQVKEGQPNVTLTGTAEEIVQQILAANPDYQFPTVSNKTHRALEERQDPRLNPPPPTKWGTRENSVASSDDDWLLTRWDCNYGTGVWFDLTDGNVAYLEKLGNGACVVPRGPNGLARVACSSSASVFVVNDNNYQVQIPCIQVAHMAWHPMYNCRWEQFSASLGRFHGFTRGRSNTIGNWWVNINRDSC
ncbi:hypothetical protein N657DRAFT_675162 [Parathielavia appendiculata]|uniref:Uncharacterized protein n=1 Tax=Parathielavia appendiculata TaxID=2587402 RepID=A0AAN6TQZ0_9PEZI|nr:hypothetical protein N657DRAFT_675162 [Parathielavia appendiculata]